MFVKSYPCEATTFPRRGSHLMTVNAAHICSEKTRPTPPDTATAQVLPRKYDDIGMSSPPPNPFPLKRAKVSEERQKSLFF